MALKVNEQSPEVAEKNIPWTIVEDVLAGTIRMREKRVEYLPKRLREHLDDHAKRVNSAVLFGGTKTTLGSLVGRAFADPVEIEDGPAWFELIADNIDSRGKKLGVWSKEWFTMAMVHGYAWALVDTPVMPPGQSQAQQAGKNPYAVAISARNVLGWVYDGANLAQVRIMWAREEREQFGAVQVPQVRVYDRLEDTVTLSVYEERENAKNAKEWTLVEGPTPINVKRIPLVRVEFGDMPPLLELAHYAIQLFQRESSASSLIDVAEVPILTVIGRTDTEIEIGAKSALQLSVGGDAKYCEHTGKAIEAGRQYRLDIKEAMQQIGARFTQPKNATIKTATQSGEEAANENSELAEMVIRFQDALTDLIDLIAEFAGQESQGTVIMHPNLKHEAEPQVIMGMVNGMVTNRTLSRETAFGIAKGLPLGIPDETTWEEESAKIEAETPEEPQVGLPAR
jgi:hypothetical protein